DKAFDNFMQEVLPGIDEPGRQLAGELLTDVLGAAGKQFSERPRTATEIATYADAMADMFCAYLERLASR
ncbi:MAG TPA: TetR/AcrR family transcriptional regulator, partial [Stenotrophomonas sp.]